MSDLTSDRPPPRYSVQMEVAGPLAMFARPDTGGTPTSYRAPTWSAANGLFESIAFLANAAAWFSRQQRGVGISSRWNGVPRLPGGS